MTPIQRLHWLHAGLVEMTKASGKRGEHNKLPGDVRYTDKRGRPYWAAPKREKKQRARGRSGEEAPATRATSGFANETWAAFADAAEQVIRRHVPRANADEAVAHAREAFRKASHDAAAGKPIPVSEEMLSRIHHAERDFLLDLMMQVQKDHGRFSRTDDEELLGHLAYAGFMAAPREGTPQEFWTTASPDADMLGQVRWTDEQYQDQKGQEWRKVLLYGDPYTQKGRWSQEGDWSGEHPRKEDDFRQSLEKQRADRQAARTAALQRMEKLSLDDLREQRRELERAIGDHDPDRKKVAERIAVLESKQKQAKHETTAKARLKASGLPEAVAKADVVVVVGRHRGEQRAYGGKFTVEPDMVGESSGTLLLDGQRVGGGYRPARRYADGWRGDGVAPPSHVLLSTDVPAAVIAKVFDGSRFGDPSDLERLAQVEHNGKTYYASRSRYGRGIDSDTLLDIAGRRVTGRRADAVLTAMAEKGTRANVEMIELPGEQISTFRNPFSR